MSNPKKRGNNRKRVFLDVFSPSENDPGVRFPVKNLFPALENWWTFAVWHCSYTMHVPICSSKPSNSCSTLENIPQFYSDWMN